jgi:hypothetical protein
MFNVVASPGDFNLDGVVDGADYVKWRKSDNTPANYDLWRANFGNTSTVVFPGASAGNGDGFVATNLIDAQSSTVTTLNSTAASSSSADGQLRNEIQQPIADRHVLTRSENKLAGDLPQFRPSERPTTRRWSARAMTRENLKDDALLVWLALRPNGHRCMEASTTRLGEARYGEFADDVLHSFFEQLDDFGEKARDSVAELVTCRF